MSDILSSELSEDSLFFGKLTCLQHRHGYRFSVDAVLLAHFIAPAAGDRILDLGAGCGVVSLLLGYRNPFISLCALELQPALAELCRRNALRNSLADRLQVKEGDLRSIDTLPAAGSFDWVVANPPYRKNETGRRNLDQEQAIARHEIKADLGAVVRAAAYTLKTRGRSAFVYPAARAAALINELINHGLAPKRLRVVHSYPGESARLVLVEAVKAGGEELAILPPLYIYEAAGGCYSKEMAKMYEP
jgi:tRNA1(Val) A37 N6-methylase TrmN6